MKTFDHSTLDEPDSSQPDLTAVGSHVSDTSDAADSYEIARFDIGDSHRLTFSYEEETGDLALLQEGRLGEGRPILPGRDLPTIAEVYLHIADSKLPVPEELLEESRDSAELFQRLSGREIATEGIRSTAVSEEFRAETQAAAGQTCFSIYYSWWDWHDPATPGMSPHAYYASQFGGKKRYSQSYIANCTPAGWGSWLWARHRIYYKKSNGKYKKHFEGKVAPSHWQAKTKGSIKRYRRILYDDGWNSSPSNASLKYTREGRFRN